MKAKITIILLCVIALSCSKVIDTQTGLASYYSPKLDGNKTASGEIYKNRKLTAAHRTLEFGTKVLVTNLENGKSVKVVINDRGPFIKNRIIDLSYSAAKKIGLQKKGIARVKLNILN